MLVQIPGSDVHVNPNDVASVYPLEGQRSSGGKWKCEVEYHGGTGYKRTVSTCSPAEVAALLNKKRQHH